jgi:hypothetical protein
MDGKLEATETGVQSSMASSGDWFGSQFIMLNLVN